MDFDQNKTYSLSESSELSLLLILHLDEKMVAGYKYYYEHKL